MSRADHSFTKSEWRQRNIEFLKSCPGIVDDRGRLIRPYVELIGNSGIDSFNQMKESGLLSDDKHFIGTDRDGAVIYNLHKRRIPFRLITNQDGISSVSYMIMNNCDVGSFNFDSYVWAGNTEWWAGQGSNLCNIINNRIEEIGIFVVIINMALDNRRNKMKCSETIKTYISSFKKEVPLVSETELATDEECSRVDDRSYIGPIGGMEVYRSSTVRMLTSRHYFNRERLNGVEDTEITRIRL